MLGGLAGIVAFRPLAIPTGELKMLKQLTGIIVCLLMLLVSAASAKENILYSFQGGADGSSPHAGLTHDRLGNLYGTTSKGGEGMCFGLGCGTVFMLTRGDNNTWTKSTIHTFNDGIGGGVPVGTLAIDPKGNLYGVTEQGGTGPCDSVLGAGCGVIYRLSPNGDGTFGFKVLYSFSQPGTVDDGSYPNAGVVIGRDGSLYGTTEFGGSFVCDCGIVYRLTANGGQWRETVLYSFVGISQGGSDVSFPSDTVTIDSGGNIFGTGSGGGDVLCNDGCGGVYVLVPQGGAYQEHVLHIFEGGNDGAAPQGEVTLDASGNIFGTTGAGGGGTHCDQGCGIVFELEKTGDQFQYKIIYRFDGINGAEPFSALLLDNSEIFGTTAAGGTAAEGTAFRLSQVSGTWKETALYNFGRGSDGTVPFAPLIGNSRVGFFGTTAGGGQGHAGTVFQLH